ncbi:hypothetical protein [Gemmatimonas sp.]|uniref:hypothetical protein n=1 Tax=Gemmatimonas sp. TaxID=1962908 RepID=UPI003341C6B4
MTTPITSSRAGFGALTYARSRLYLGISGVGTAVLAAGCLLAFDIPSAGFPATTETSLARSMFAVGLFFLLVFGLFFLFDLVGGAWVVRRRDNAPSWFGTWVRGVAVQWVVWMLTGTALMVAARSGGVLAAVLVFVGVQILLAQFRGPLARVIARLERVPMPPVVAQAAEKAGIPAARVQVLDTADEGFVGGWSGVLPGTLVVPRRWAMLPVDVLAAQLARRQLIATTGAHTRGVSGALAWNTAGLGVVLLATAATPATAAGLVTIMAGMTLWAFAGVLVLPTPSRAAVYAADRSAATVHSVAQVRTGIELLDKWQDDEPTRAQNVERIFHPVPSRANRIARLSGTSSPLGAVHAHHLARHALWMNWGALTPLSRAVHCNVGRPALWAMLPGD